MKNRRITERRQRLAIAVLVFVFGTLPAQADSILLGVGSSGNVQGAVILPSTQQVAQSFTLSTAIQLTAINVLNCCGYAGVLQLTNALGLGTSSANVLAQASFGVANGFGPSGTGYWIAIPVNLQLGPGTYYLVQSSAGGGGWWMVGGAALPSTVGAVGATLFSTPSGSGFAPGDTWSSGPGSSLIRNPDGSIIQSTTSGSVQFELVGQPVAQNPEPATLLLIATGVAGVWWRRRQGSTC